MYPRKTQSSHLVKPKKCVSFYHTAGVVLIPTVKEYHDAGLASLLWWNDDEFHGFKVSTASEVREYVSAASPTMSRADAKLAMKLYFQEFIDEEDVLNSNYNKSFIAGQSQQQNILPLPIVAQRSDSITGKHSTFPHQAHGQEEANQLFPEQSLPSPAFASQSSNCTTLSSYDPKDK
jgi:hypothetical protein